QPRPCVSRVAAHGAGLAARRLCRTRARRVDARRRDGGEPWLRPAPDTVARDRRHGARGGRRRGRDGRRGLRRSRGTALVAPRSRPPPEPAVAAELPRRRVVDDVGRLGRSAATARPGVEARRRDGLARRAVLLTPRDAAACGGGRVTLAALNLEVRYDARVAVRETSLALAPGELV